MGTQAVHRCGDRGDLRDDGLGRRGRSIRGRRVEQPIRQRVVRATGPTAFAGRMLDTYDTPSCVPAPRTWW